MALKKFTVVYTAQFQDNHQIVHEQVWEVHAENVIHAINQLLSAHNGNKRVILINEVRTPGRVIEG